MKTKMGIFYSNYYIKFIILSILFFQYHALENNDSVSLDLIQSYLSSKNFISHDSFVHSIRGISENNYLRKRQIENEGVKRKQRSFLSEKNNNEVKVYKRQAGKTLGKKFPGIKPPGIRPPYPGHPIRRPPTRRTTPRRTTLRRTTPRRTTPGRPPNGRPTTKKPGPRPTPSKRTTKKQTTSKKPLPRPSVRPSLRPQIPKLTTTTTKRTTTTVKPDKYADLKSQLIKDINNLRSKHRAPALTFDQTLAERAQKLANGFKEKQFRIIEKNDVGTLISFSKSKKEYDPLFFWTSGSEHINYNNLENEPVKDFMQLIWVKTTNIGCSISEIDSKGSLLTICLLSPKGNIQGEYDENVHRPF